MRSDCQESFLRREPITTFGGVQGTGVDVEQHQQIVPAQPELPADDLANRQVRQTDRRNASTVGDS